MKKIVLISKSQGDRGQSGKKKIYEITIDGALVTLSWGKAEEDNRQSQTKLFSNELRALEFAIDKQVSKLDKGYSLAFTA